MSESNSIDKVNQFCQFFPEVSEKLVQTNFQRDRENKSQTFFWDHSLETVTDSLPLPQKLVISFEAKSSRRTSVLAQYTQAIIGPAEVPLDGVSRFELRDRSNQVMAEGELRNPLVGHRGNGFLRKNPWLRPNISHDLITHFMLIMLNPLTQKYNYLTEFLEGAYTIAANRRNPRTFQELRNYSDKSQLVVAALDSLPEVLKTAIANWAKRSLKGDLLLLTPAAVQAYSEGLEKYPAVFSQLRHGVASDFEKAYLRHTREGTLAQFRFERTLPAAVVNALMDITTHVLRSMQQQAEKNPEYGIQPDSIPVSFCEALYLIESERKRES